MGDMRRIVLQATATTISAVATMLGTPIPIPGGYNYATLNLTYVNGDETSLTVYPTFLDQMGGVEAQWMEWTAAAGAKTPTVCSLSMNASGSYQYTFDITGKANMRFFEVAVGGTPTGTLVATVTLKGD